MEEIILAIMLDFLIGEDIACQAIIPFKFDICIKGRWRDNRRPLVFLVEVENKKSME